MSTDLTTSGDVRQRQGSRPRPLSGTLPLSPSTCLYPSPRSWRFSHPRTVNADVIDFQFVWIATYVNIVTVVAIGATLKGLGMQRQKRRGYMVFSGVCVGGEGGGVSCDVFVCLFICL